MNETLSNCNKQDNGIQYKLHKPVISCWHSAIHLVLTCTYIVGTSYVNYITLCLSSIIANVSERSC